ncbi:hypothetical protein HHL26_04680 [Sphingobium sp. TB-6]|uniref:hypothetical protein n=1 Tax=Sphingobium sp. TB-6 TaxID=2728850 RepID=UPI00146D2B13|nr:hypothetical protein [Sphingobium sp. TB-6]NML88361.1 hypothetical protein [Sphingobium sp. TB-6]
MPKQRKRRGLRKVQLVPARALPLLKEAGVMLPDGEPEIVYGYLDRQGGPRRIIARYPGGWRADLRIRVDGSYSLTQSLKLKLTTQKPEGA